MRKSCIPLALGAAILLLFLLAAFFPTLFTQYGQKEMFGPWLEASPEHLLGTNALGYDIFTELIYGTRQTLLVGLTSSILTLLLGGVIHLKARPVVRPEGAVLLLPFGTLIFNALFRSI